MINCLFCLKRTENKFIYDCEYKKCSLENICENCYNIHIEYHKELENYDRKERILLNSLNNSINGKVDLGNSTGFFE